MKRIIHLVGYDLRRMRFWAAGWLAMLLAPIVAVLAATKSGLPELDLSTLKDVTSAVTIAQVIVGYLIVVVLMQGDPVIGTRQFWLTRPIGVWRMWSAKLLGAFTLIGGGAIVVGVPWWWYCGAGGAEIVRLAGEYLLLASAVIAPAMLLSALTDSLARAILWSFALGAFVMVATMPLSLVSFNLAAGSSAGGLIVAMWLAVGGAWVAGALVVSAGIFLTRRRSWVIVAGAMALVVPWPVGVLLSKSGITEGEPKEFRAERAAGIGVNFRGATSRQEPARKRVAERMRFDALRVSFAADAPKEELQLMGVGAAQRWSWPGATFERKERLNAIGRLSLPGFREPARDAESDARRAELREQMLATRRETQRRMMDDPAMMQEVGKVRLQAASVVPSSWPARMVAEPAQYETRLWLALVQPEVRNEIALRPGEQRAGRGHRAVITRMDRSGNGTTLGVTHFTPQFWTKEAMREMKRQRWFWTELAPNYLCLNAEKKEFATVSRSRRRAFSVHGVNVEELVLTVHAERVWRNGQWVEPPGWIEGATLAYVGMKTEAIFARDVRVEEFTVKRTAED